MSKYRLDTLDSFRFFAILAVMLFHYFTRWTPPQYNISLYPYGSKFNFFPYGKYGVQFFFIISGFVITYTLSTTDSVKDFWKKRFVRLFPAMFLASVITYICIISFDSKMLFPHGHSITNLLYSLSFVSPDLLNSILAPVGIRGNYINGSYWSLWPEIQFYFLVSTLYFLNKKDFIRNFFIIVLIFSAVRLFVGNLKTTNTFHIHIGENVIPWYNYWIGQVFDLPTYILWFFNGVLFHEVYFKKAGKQGFIFLFISIFLTFYFDHAKDLLTVDAVILLMFGLFLWKPSVFSGRFVGMFNKVGVASYFLYLIHEDLGVLIINRVGPLFGALSWLFTLLLIVTFSVLSVWVYQFYEKPVGGWLRSILNRRN